MDKLEKPIFVSIKNALVRLYVLNFASKGPSLFLLLRSLDAGLQEKSGAHCS